MSELDANDPVLQQVAASDADPAVRRHALRCIDDVAVLARLLQDETEETVRESLDKRLKRLLAGEEACVAELSERRRVMLALGDEAILGYVLQHAAETPLREAALDAVSRPALLAEVALSDPSGELRLVALERIDRVPTIERIARQAKGKDKRVARRARERLEAMRTEAERPERQQAICEALEALVVQGGVDLIACDRLKREWQDVLPAASEVLAKRFDLACETFAEAQSRFQAEAALTARQRELCERIEQLQREVEASEADLNGMDSAVTLLQRAWQGLEEEASALNPAMVERFHSALAATEQRRVERLAQHQEQARLQGIIDELAAAREEALDRGRLERIEQAWKAAGGGRAQQHIAALQTRFAQALEQARQQLAQQTEERDRLQGEVVELLSQLELALDEGQLKQAASCHDKARDRLQRLKALGGRIGGTQQKRLMKAAARLHELRDWRRFGTDHAREALLEQMNALGKKPLAPQQQAEAVKGLRDEWKRLDRRDGPAQEALWQAFEQAAETAYAPCRAYHEAQQQQRADNRRERERFLDELEQALEVDEAADWAKLEQRLQQARKRWLKLGGVEHKAWQALNGRFRRAIATFEKRLEPQREREKARREGLITKVERLADEPDLEKALSETRSAQAAWRPEVSAPPRVEQALWRRFKAACDAVYARQREKAQAVRESEEAALALLEGYCNELEALATGLTEAGLAQAKGRLTALRAEWDEVPRSSSRGYRSLQQRFDKAVEGFGQAQSTLEQRQASAAQQLLLEKAALCEALEAALFEPAIDVASVIAAWQAMPALDDGTLEQVLEQRFSRTRQAIEDGAEAIAGLTAGAAENLGRRQSLCLQLELLAGIDSPPAFAEARLALQVEMLSDAMTGKLVGEERRRMARELLEQYLAIAPIPPEEGGPLVIRLQAVLPRLARLKN